MEKRWPWCRRCGSSDVRRSARRNPFEKAISVVCLPFRCNKCDERFFRFRFAGTRQEASAVPEDKPETKPETKEDSQYHEVNGAN